VIDPTPRPEAILRFERSWRAVGGPKPRAIRERLGISPIRYHQLLNAVLDLPEALTMDPGLVLRLRRLREARRARRFPRGPSGGSGTLG
jgi:hypothetical protein